MINIIPFYEKNGNKYQLKVVRDITTQHSHVTVIKNGVEIGYFHFVPYDWEKIESIETEIKIELILFKPI
jgi:hypothetical protein